MFSTLLFLIVVFAAAYVWVKKKEARINGTEWSFTKVFVEKSKAAIKWFRENFLQ